mgnify:CR=1 FL=1
MSFGHAVRPDRKRQRCGTLETFGKTTIRFTRIFGCDERKPTTSFRASARNWLRQCCIAVVIAGMAYRLGKYRRQVNRCDSASPNERASSAEEVGGFPGHAAFLARVLAREATARQNVRFRCLLDCHFVCLLHLTDRLPQTTATASTPPTSSISRRLSSCPEIIPCEHLSLPSLCSARSQRPSLMRKSPPVRTRQQQRRFRDIHCTEKSSTMVHVRPPIL